MISNFLNDSDHLTTFTQQYMTKAAHPVTTGAQTSFSKYKNNSCFRGVNGEVKTYGGKNKLWDDHQEKVCESRMQCAPTVEMDYIFQID